MLLSEIPAVHGWEKELKGGGGDGSSGCTFEKKIFRNKGDKDNDKARKRIGMERALH